MAAFRMIVPDDFAAHCSMFAALDGNVAPLAARVRAGVQLRNDERAFLADFLEGKVKKPPHRQERAATRFKRRDIANFTMYYEAFYECKREAAVTATMAFYKISRSYVFECLNKEIPENDGELMKGVFKGFVALSRGEASAKLTNPIAISLDLPKSLYPPSPEK